MTNETSNAPETKQAPFANREQYTALIEKHGLAWTEQSGFIKVQMPGARLYVAATKTVRRVDLSGFEMDLNEQITKLPHCGVFGQVKQQMVVGTGPEGDLERFEEVLVHAASLPAPAPKEKKVRAKKAKAVPQAPAVQPISDRMALIRKVAAEKGLAVSSQSLALAAE